MKRWFSYGTEINVVASAMVTHGERDVTTDDVLRRSGLPKIAELLALEVPSEDRRELMTEDEAIRYNESRALLRAYTHSAKIALRKNGYFPLPTRGKFGDPLKRRWRHEQHLTKRQRKRLLDNWGEQLKSWSEKLEEQRAKWHVEVDALIEEWLNEVEGPEENVE